MFNKKLLRVLICLSFCILLCCTCCNNKYIEINYDWYLEYLNVPEAWKKTKGEGITVAVIDSGIDYNLLGEGFDKTRIKQKYNAIDESENITDYTLHGTGIVSLIGANGENGYWGIAPKCDFIIIKALNEIGSTNSETLVRAINYSIENDADIINLSLGGLNYNEQVDCAIKTAYKNNIIVVAAAGDDEKEKVRFPASLNETISVGAIDKDGVRYKGSNYGAAVDVFMPAVDVSVPAYDLFKRRITVKKSGSSVATAIMSGVIALRISILENYTVDDLYDFFRTDYPNDVTKNFFKEVLI